MARTKQRITNINEGSSFAKSAKLGKERKEEKPFQYFPEHKREVFLSDFRFKESEYMSKSMLSETLVIDIIFKYVNDIFTYYNIRSVCKTMYDTLEHLRYNTISLFTRDIKLCYEEIKLSKNIQLFRSGNTKRSGHIIINPGLVLDGKEILKEKLGDEMSFDGNHYGSSNDFLQIGINHLCKIDYKNYSLVCVDIFDKNVVWECKIEYKKLFQNRVLYNNLYSLDEYSVKHFEIHNGDIYFGDKFLVLRIDSKTGSILNSSFISNIEFIIYDNYIIVDGGEVISRYDFVEFTKFEQGKINIDHKSILGYWNGIHYYVTVSYDNYTMLHINTINIKQGYSKINHIVSKKINNPSDEYYLLQEKYENGEGEYVGFPDGVNTELTVNMYREFIVVRSQNYCDYDDCYLELSCFFIFDLEGNQLYKSDENTYCLSIPVFFDGIMVIADDGGIGAYALNNKTVTQLWNVSQSYNPGIPVDGGGINCALTLNILVDYSNNSSYVYFHSTIECNTLVMCINLYTGKTVWIDKSRNYSLRYIHQEKRCVAHNMLMS